MISVLSEKFISSSSSNKSASPLPLKFRKLKSELPCRERTAVIADVETQSSYESNSASDKLIGRVHIHPALEKCW